ncbi:MAG: UDP-N-acetylmuramate dehydrogenase [Desulfobacterota bacterium]|nr:UDP-N-acetylmuramate dehydrogenase [Thermodesulfobacteriota bacterium]
MCSLISNYPLAKLTRFGTGGNALLYAEPTSTSQLHSIITYAHEKNLICCIIGGGTNILVNDNGVNGLVIKLSGAFKTISFDDARKTVVAGAGVPLIKLGLAIARRGFEGYAYMGVIPGSVGGAVRMNAGIGDGQEIGNHFASAMLFDIKKCTIGEVDASALAFRYRTSMLAHMSAIVLHATFQLPELHGRHKERALRAIQELLVQRSKRHPKNPRTFGSTFKNPCTGRSAGWYLEQVGMKGMRIGGAMVPYEHANWIVNTGNATTYDARQLIEIARQRVYETFGIQLEREVVYVPEDLKGINGEQ